MSAKIDTTMLDYQNFLDEFFKQIDLVGLDVIGLPLDHVAYQARTSDEYDQLKLDFRKISEGVHEAIIGNRRVGVFKLYQPFIYKNYTIEGLELLEPKQGQVCESGFQHAEFIANKPFEKYMEQYPNLNWDTSSMNRSEFSHLKFHFKNGLTLKFLKKPILELVATQN